MKIWIVSREYAGIAEAGGVKSVACSLCESLAQLGHKVTFFIPVYKCTDFSHIEQKILNWKNPVSFDVAGKKVEITFSHGYMKNVEIIFINHNSFAEKNAVYTYTKEEQQENPLHKQGEGHCDKDFLNMIFQKAVLYYSKNCTQNDSPEIIHCQDAPTSMIPVFASCIPELKNFFCQTKFVVTIHNAGPGYHHEFKNIEEAQKFSGLDKEFLEKGRNGECIEPFLLASKFACITTVSPEYATEILSGKTDTAGLSECFRNNVNIIGITNGIDFSKYAPEDIKKSLLKFPFNPITKDLEGKYKNRDYFLENFASKQSLLKNKKSKDLIQYGFIDTQNCNEDFVYIVYHGRVVHQKGIEVILKTSEKMMNKNLPVRFIFAGQGAINLENDLISWTQRFEGKCVYFKGYNKVLARHAICAADFSLHPSYFEPCGLEDFIAQILGTLPIAHATGGLCKIVDDETGWLYFPNNFEILENELESLVHIVQHAGRDILKSLISYASKYVHENYSWNKVSLEYEKLYKNLISAQ